MEPLVIEEFIFERSRARERLGWGMLAGAVGMAGVGLLGFGWALFHPVDQITLHALSTFPIIIACGLASGGWTLSRGPRRVTVDTTGLEIEQAGKAGRHLWSDLGWATVAAAGMSHQKNLIIYDKSGRQLASLSEAFQDFDELVAVVKSRLADQPAEIVGEIQACKARKSALFIASVASILLAVSAAVAWMTSEELRAAQLLSSAAIDGEGTIDRLFLAPNGVTTRVEYTVKNDAGQTGQRNAEIKSDYYAELQRAHATTIPVRFVPAEPGISRLQRGEVPDDEFMKTPLGGYGLSGVVALMCLFFLGVAVMQWNGWDIDLDSKTGKLSIKRFGEGK